MWRLLSCSQGRPSPVDRTVVDTPFMRQVLRRGTGRPTLGHVAVRLPTLLPVVGHLRIAAAGMSEVATVARRFLGVVVDTQC